MTPLSAVLFLKFAYFTFQEKCKLLSIYAQVILYNVLETINIPQNFLHFVYVHIKYYSIRLIYYSFILSCYIEIFSMLRIKVLKIDLVFINSRIFTLTFNKYILFLETKHCRVYNRLMALPFNYKTHKQWRPDGYAIIYSCKRLVGPMTNVIWLY